MACNNCQVCHLHIAVVQRSHAANLVAVYADIVHILAETTVDFFYDLIDSRQQHLKQIYTPALQSFCHNGVVGVSDGSGNNIPCLFPTVAAFVHHNPHQFRNSQNRVGIVQVDCNYIRQLIQRAVYL